MTGAPVVSIVVCTYNRADYLDECIRSLLRQTYKKYEIIVVNGPSTDNTDKVLKKYPGVKVIRQEKLNGLSFARNLGINNAKGGIIAFIDDDATADESWLAYLIEGYSDESVGGVGGYTVNHSGYVQFDNGVINDLGIPTAVRKEGEVVKKGEYPISMGANCSFRKKVLFEVDGFDPYFKYYHDESDLCVRIIKAGYKIVYQKKAVVVHVMAEGHNRKSPYDLAWSEVIKNVIYFTMKNFRGELQAYTIRPIKAVFWWLRYFYGALKKGDLPPGKFFHIHSQVFKGAMMGYLDGLFYKDKGKHLAGLNVHSMDCDILKVCFLSQEFSRDCGGGICRYTYDLAHGLSDMGCEVHVIKKSDRPNDYDSKDGKVFVHNIVPADQGFLGLSDDMVISKKNISYSYSAAIKLQELIDKCGIQIVEAPLWDAESFAFSLVKSVPLVVRLETPLFKIAEIEHWPVTRDIRLANWIEGEAARRADRVIAISRNIGSMIEKQHGLKKEDISLCPLGIAYTDMDMITDQKDHTHVALFVGRLEKRKGIETLFEAIPDIVEIIPDARFNIIGSDTASADGGSYKNYLLGRLDKKYHKNVHLIGYVDANRLSEYYRDCDVFVAPSLYESFGLIYIEAMAWRKPVIGCAVGGVPEVVRGGETGLLIKPGEQKELAKALIKLLSDNDLRIGMGKKGRMLVEEEFSVNNMVERTYKIYCEALKK